MKCNVVPAYLQNLCFISLTISIHYSLIFSLSFLSILKQNPCLLNISGFPLQNSSLCKTTTTTTKVFLSVTETGSLERAQSSPPNPSPLSPSCQQMFVRLFVDENLDRMVPISKQPKEKIQAIIDSCRRQFPEYQERARKRIRTYLKSCRRMKRSGFEMVSFDLKPSPSFHQNPHM